MKTILSLMLLGLIGVAPISVLSAVVQPEPAIAGPQQPTSKIQSEAAIRQIKPGMTRQQVLGKLGKPMAQKGSWVQYWVGSQRTTVFIWFHNGKVVEVGSGAG
jgi:outer membrane protein assembly factor BamE (lipoprotein component of BamABCDE complex)